MPTTYTPTYPTLTLPDACGCCPCECNACPDRGGLPCLLYFTVLASTCLYAGAPGYDCPPTDLSTSMNNPNLEAGTWENSGRYPCVGLVGSLDEESIGFAFRCVDVGEFEFILTFYHSTGVALVPVAKATATATVGGSNTCDPLYIEFSGFAETWYDPDYGRHVSDYCPTIDDLVIAVTE